MKRYNIDTINYLDAASRSTLAIILPYYFLMHNVVESVSLVALAASTSLVALYMKNNNATLDKIEGKEGATLKLVNKLGDVEIC